METTVIVYGLDPNREYEIGLDVVDGQNDEDENSTRSTGAGSGGGGGDETTRIGGIELGEGEPISLHTAQLYYAEHDSVLG